MARARHEVLKDTSGFLKFRSHQHQFDLPKRRKIAIGGNRRVFQPSAATARAFQKSLLVKAALMNEEGVWMLGLKPIRLQRGCRKILQIVRDDDAGVS